MVPKKEPEEETNQPNELPSEPKPKSRQDRMAQHNLKCERIVHYLRHGKHQHGLTKNEQRVVRSQAKNYVLDESSTYITLF